MCIYIYIYIYFFFFLAYFPNIDTYNKIRGKSKKEKNRNVSDETEDIIDGLDTNNNFFALK